MPGSPADPTEVVKIPTEQSLNRTFQRGCSPFAFLDQTHWFRGSFLRVPLNCRFPTFLRSNPYTLFDA
jgi:hypothetical protein